MIERTAYDAVICDVKMPELSGQELYGRVCQIRPEMAGRFIFITGDIDALWLRNRLAAAHYADLQIRPEPIKQLIARYNAGEAVPPIEIAHCVDASLQIMISLDGLSARLTLIPAKGGQPATKADVLALIQGQGIVEGVLVDEINRAIAEGKADDLVIARGREPVPGEDGRLESLLPEARERVPSVNASGRTDYRDLGEVQIVRTGEALVRRQPGFVSRRLSLGTDGQWTDAVTWASLAHAEAAPAVVMADPDFQPFMALIDGPSARMRHEALALTLD